MSVLTIVGIYLSIVMGIAGSVVCSWRIALRKQKRVKADIDRMNERIAPVNRMPSPVFDLMGRRVQ